MNAASARFVTAFKSDLVEYEETLMTSPLGMEEECPSGFAGKEESGEESEEGLDEELDEELDVLLDREERRLEAKRLDGELEDMHLGGDFYFDYAGILWMHQG
ncbi:hypothetical protein PV326_012238 [Microctonus aethiopoides]|nr:hypothetical protein PV326_012238 [Microctonus aethiopoides]